MTHRQKQLLDFIKAYIREHGFSPNFKEMSQSIGISQSNIYRILNALEYQGKIKRLRYRARTIEVTEQYDTTLAYDFIIKKGLQEEFRTFVGL